MKEQDPDTNYTSLMKARKDGLFVQTEREFREEQDHVLQSHIKHRQSLFDEFYGDIVTQKERNEIYTVIDRERRKSDKEKSEFYPKAVRNKMQTVRNLIAELRELGVDEAALSDLVRPERPISRLYITADYRIFLPEFEGKEVMLGPLPKAVFILFLRHPEGIILKEMGFYFTELLNIYKGIQGRKFHERKARLSLARICDPLDNSLNEKISRIHEGLRNVLDETLAASYFIVGKRCEARQILIPQTLINWEV